MQIVVIVRSVLDPAGIVVNRRRRRVFVNREEYVMQPADRCALEAALRIKDQGNGKVIALTYGPLPGGLAASTDVLRQALAVGADRAIQLVEPGSSTRPGSAALWDAAVGANVSAAAVGRLGGVDLLLTGAATLDTGQSQLGSRLATALAWPQIVYAWQVTCRRATVQAVLQEGHGYVAVETDLPAVITLHPDALRLRYPNGARLINVYRDADAVEQWDMGEDAFKPLLEGHRQEFPPERERGMRVSGTPDEMAQVLADVFKAHALCQVGSEGDYG